MIRIKSPARILLVALALGWSVDLLFYGKALGISVPLFVLLLMVTLFGLGWLEGVRPVRRNLWLLAPLIFFASMVFVRANPFVTFLNVVASLALLGFIAHFYAAGHPQRLGLIGYPIVLLRTTGNALIRPAPLVSASMDLKAARQRGSRNLLPVIRGLLLALPVLVIFTLLLASADLIFADYLEDLFSLDILPDLLEWLWRGIIILGSAWFLAGSLAYALGRSQASDEQGVLEKALGSLAQVERLGFIEAATLLISVDLLFLVFVWIQFAYLFGGRANITVEGYTYAEYARRGFFELVAGVGIGHLGLRLPAAAPLRGCLRLHPTAALQPRLHGLAGGGLRLVSGHLVALARPLRHRRVRGRPGLPGNLERPQPRRLHRRTEPGSLPGQRQTGCLLPDPAVRRYCAHTGAGRRPGNWRGRGGAA
jgi:hypothetical protein